MKLFKLLALGTLIFAIGCASSSQKDESAESAEIQGEADAGMHSPEARGDAGSSVQTSARTSDPVAVPSGATGDMYKKYISARLSRHSAAAHEAAGEILARNPHDTKILNSLAVLAIEQNKPELARLILNKVLDKDPKNASAHNNKGVIELKGGELRLALIEFKKAVELDGRLAAAHANLGAIYLQYRNYQNAVAELQAATEYGDQSPETLSNYGFALTGVQKYSKAADVYEKASSKGPANAHILMNYAVLLVEKVNRPKDALKLLNKIRFVATEPAIIEKASVLAQEAEAASRSGQ